MSKPLEREKAIALRKAGFSYSEILARVPVAKSTLSDWFREIGLSERQKQRLTAKRLAAARRGAQKLHEQRLRRITDTLRHADREAQQLLDAKELPWLVGTVLYWAEGTKIKEWRCKERVAFTNMDPKAIGLVQSWLRRYCSVSPSKIEYALYIHPDADISAAQQFWADRLGIRPPGLRTYLKRHNPTPRRKRVGTAYYGTMRVSVRRSSVLLHRIDEWIRAIVKYCGVG